MRNKQNHLCERKKNVQNEYFLLLFSQPVIAWNAHNTTSYDGDVS